MKFTELENKINEIAKEKGYTEKKNQTTCRELTDNIENIVWKLLKEAYPRLYSNKFYLTTYRGNVILKFRGYTSVDIKIKKIKGDKSWNYGFDQYYYLDKVEIEVYNKNSSIESYNRKCNEFKKARENTKNEEVDKFLKFLKEKNISLNQFSHYATYYNDNWFYIREKLGTESD